MRRGQNFIQESYARVGGVWERSWSLFLSLKKRRERYDPPARTNPARWPFLSTGRRRQTEIEGVGEQWRERARGAA